MFNYFQVLAPSNAWFVDRTVETEQEGSGRGTGWAREVGVSCGSELRMEKSQWGQDSE